MFAHRHYAMTAIAVPACALLVLSWVTGIPERREPNPRHIVFAVPIVGGQFELATDHLPDRLIVADRGRSWDASRVILRLSAWTLDGGVGSFTMERDELSFNDFGDATRTGGRDPVTFAVTLRPTGWRAGYYECYCDYGWLYDIAFPNGLFAGRFRVYRTADPGHAHRLLVRIPLDQPNAWNHGWDGDRGRVERVLELRGPSRFPDVPRAGKFSYHTLVRNWSSRFGRSPEVILQAITIRGSAAGGELHLDPNYLFIDPTGRVNGGTLLARDSIAVTFRPLTPDPRNRGRRAFVIAPTQPEGLKLKETIEQYEGGPRDHLIDEVVQATLLSVENWG